MRFKDFNRFCSKCQCDPCICNPLVLDKKMIINQLTPDGQVVEVVAEMLKRAEIETMKNVRIPEKDKFVMGNKRRETVKFYYHQGKPYVAMFVNAGVHVSSFFLGVKALEDLENFCHKKRQEILLNSDKTNDKKGK